MGRSFWSISLNTFDVNMTHISSNSWMICPLRCRELTLQNPIAYSAIYAIGARNRLRNSDMHHRRSAQRHTDGGHTEHAVFEPLAFGQQGDGGQRYRYLQCRRGLGPAVVQM